MEKKILRIIDVNLNRLRESLRIIEDLNRFYLEKKEFFIDIKNIRHLISKEVKNFLQTEQILYARDVERDSGANFSSFDELKREKVEEIFLAEFKRAEEACRALEEITKVINKKLSQFFKEIRFKLYRLEKENLLFFYKKKLNSVKLYLIVDSSLTSQKNIIEIVKLAVSKGIKLIQLRAKGLPDKKFLNLAIKLRKITQGKSFLVINDNVAIALVSGADGVHLGENDLPIDFVRRIIGNEKIIGFSTQSFRLAKQAEKLGVDYLGIGTIFPTPVKPERKIISIKKFIKIQNSVKIPVFAIGGINLNNVKELVKKGIKRIAVIRALADLKDFDKNLGKFKKILKEK